MKRFFKDLKKYRGFIVYSGKAELKSEVAQSHLSWLWWILDPLLFMLVYTFVSLVVFGKAEQYFSAFIFIGYTTFKYFEKNLKSSVKLVSGNRSIVKKVYIPKQMLMLSKTCVNLFTTAIAYMLVLCAMAIYRVPLTWNMIFFFPLFANLMIMTYGLSLILMHYGVYVEDLSNVIFVLLRLLFYLSGVFYSISRRIKDEFLRVLLVKLNPVAYVIDQMRNALLYNQPIDWIWYMVWLAVGMVLVVLGVRLVYRNENSYVKVI